MITSYFQDNKYIIDRLSTSLSYKYAVLNNNLTLDQDNFIERISPKSPKGPERTRRTSPRITWHDLGRPACHPIHFTNTWQAKCS